MKLKTEALVRAVKEWRGILVGTLIILVLTPCVSFGVLAIPSDRSALTDLLFGLAIFFTMPTTLSSGVVLTREANGNFALALLLTTVTNLLSIVLIPFVVQLLVLFQNWLAARQSAASVEDLATTASAFGGNANGTTWAVNASSLDPLEINIDAVELLMKLSLAILLPLVVGKVMLHIPQIGPAVVACTTHTSVRASVVAAVVSYARSEIIFECLLDIGCQSAISFVAVLRAGSSAPSRVVAASHIMCCVLFALHESLETNQAGDNVCIGRGSVVENQCQR